MKSWSGWMRWLLWAAVFVVSSWATFALIFGVPQEYSVLDSVMWLLILGFVVLTFVGVGMRLPLLLVVAAGISFPTILMGTAFAFPATIVGWLLVTGGLIAGAVHMERNRRKDGRAD